MLSAEYCCSARLISSFSNISILIDYLILLKPQRYAGGKMHSMLGLHRRQRDIIAKKVSELSPCRELVVETILAIKAQVHEALYFISGRIPCSRSLNPHSAIDPAVPIIECGERS